MAFEKDLQLTPFPCFQCGACCRLVNKAQETQFLDRGDGICRHFNFLEKKCGIYENRPIICRVNEQYLLNYKSNFTWKEFIVINLEACNILSNFIDTESQALKSLESFQSDNNI